MNPVRILISSFHDIHFNIILPFTGEDRNEYVPFRSCLRFGMNFCFVLTLSHSSLSLLSLELSNHKYRCMCSSV